MIYGVIGGDWWGEGATAVDFRNQLAAIDTANIELHINSEGGFVDEGVAIANAIRQHPAKVTAVVDSLAASSASLIAVAADELVMSPNSELMIHNPEGLAIGTAADFTKAAERLQMVTNNIASFYQAKAGGELQDWLDTMAAETWYSAEEAVSAGLADRVAVTSLRSAAANGGGLPQDAPIGGSDIDDLVQAGIFAYAGRANAPAPKLRPAAHKLPAKPGEPNYKEEPMDLATEIRERLGIDSDAELDDDALLAQLDERLAAQAAPAAPADVAGTVTLDEAAFAQLQSDAAAGRAARDEQIQNRRLGVVNAAIQAGKIPVSRKQHWLDAINADETGITAHLEKMQPIIPLDSIGYTGDGTESAKPSDAYPESWKPAPKAQRA